MGKITIDVDINISSEGGDHQEDDFARASASVVRLPDIFTQIAAERCVQDIEWGGADHDDQHSTEDWEDILRNHVMRLNIYDGSFGITAATDYRSRLTKIAAVACAAAQSWDRLHDQGRLRAKVFAALQTAVQNGFDMRDKAPEFIAQDLLDCDADMEGEDYAEVKEYVSEWLAENSNGVEGA